VPAVASAMHRSGQLFCAGMPTAGLFKKVAETMAMV